MKINPSALVSDIIASTIAGVVAGVIIAVALHRIEKKRGYSG